MNYSVDKAQVGLNTAITQKVCKSWLSLTMLSCLGSFASWAAGGHTDLLCEPELSKRTMASEMGFCIVRSLYSFQILLKVKFKVGKGEPSCVIAVPNKWLFKGCEIRMLDLFICVHRNCSPKPGNGWNGASLLSFREKLGLSLSQTWSFLLWGGNCVQESEQSKTSCMNCEGLSLEHCLSLWVSIQNCQSVHCFPLHHLLSAAWAVRCSCWAHNWKKYGFGFLKCPLSDLDWTDEHGKGWICKLHFFLEGGTWKCRLLLSSVRCGIFFCSSDFGKALFLCRQMKVQLPCWEKISQVNAPVHT